MGKIVFVGAGPGDPELITVKGMKALEAAQVVLFDALLSPELLEYCSGHCKFIYVGKRKGKKEFSQDEINRLLVFYAGRYDQVVRLKGGDPNVFGRGHEEAMFVEVHGYKTETIPGVSSAIAAPNAAGIPLTKRGISESFWVITGTLSNGEISGDIKLAAQSTATIVILMGVSHLEEIAGLICRLRSHDEPMAMIQHATFNEEKIVVGTASNITAIARGAEMGSPGVIVIGKVVNERCLYGKLVPSKSTLVARNQTAR
jgi:uroporphyrin-III C-methyltransferase